MYTRGPGSLTKVMNNNNAKNTIVSTMGKAFLMSIYTMEHSAGFAPTSDAYKATASLQML